MSPLPAASVHHLDGVDGTIRIERDRWGIPHVIAHTLRDLFFGQGYATAADRSWHLEWDRRRAHGTLAAVTGQTAHAVGDAFARRARLGDVARAGYAALTDRERLPLDAHAAGINAYNEQVRAAAAPAAAELQVLGIDAGRWEPADAVATFQIRHVLFATWQTKLWRARVLAALGPDAVARFNREGTWGDTPVIVPAGVRAAVGELDSAGLFDDGTADAALAALQPLGLQLSGSNCWVVHGGRTASGRPIITGDPHRAFEVPNVYYQLRLTCAEEGIEAAGFSFPGVPGIQHFGQNAHLAWGVTNAMADYQDLYIERLPDAVIDRRTETVEVAGAADQQIDCLLTRHGPIVVGGEQHGVGVALASTGMVDPAGSLRTLVPLLRPTTAEELDRALADWVEPLNNWVIADRAGDVAYRTTGRVPVRTAINAWLPVPGWTTEHDWSGVIADAELPRQRNPDVGAIVTANQRVTDRLYPHLLGSDCYGAARAQRIWDRLGERRDLTGADLAAICGDTVNPAGVRAVELVEHPVLAGWDGRMDVDEPAAALYAAARHQLVRLVVARLPEALRSNPFAPWEPPSTALPIEQRVDQALDGWLAAGDTLVLADGESWPALWAEALRDAEVELGETLGADPSAWRWGDRHQVTPLHPLRHALGEQVRPTTGPIAGGSGCVMATNQLDGLTANALTGSVARYLW
ncbi:MAG: penicillin acylase family protein, partial [Acidimicrobiales bacterium]|nr:penicillin acylase family protein [Acidimicrobiales bacterium]